MEGIVTFDSSFWRSLISLAFYPLPFLCLLAIGILLCRWRRQFRLAKALGYLAMIYFLAVSTSPLPDFLVHQLEATYPPILQVPNTDVSPKILVLGAGHTNNPSLQLPNQLTHSELYRLVEGIRLQRLLPNSLLVTSGGKSRTNHEAQAVVAKKVAVLLGIPEENMDTLVSTTNTMDEALHFKQRYGTDNPLILVTDAVHMPRAMRWFRKFGLDPIAAPTNHRIKDEPKNRGINLLPNSSSITDMEIVIHEYLGILWMRLLDWSGSLDKYRQNN